MQRVIEFKKKKFWESSVDIKALNEQIFSLNKDGWIVKELIPNCTLFGVVSSYTLLVILES